MVICGQEFNFSVLNANDMDRFEDANERMQQAGRAEEERFNRGGVRLGDHMRAQARLVMACIDEILGAGASVRLGLDENDAASIYDGCWTPSTRPAWPKSSAIPDASPSPSP